jgi:murein DD-endopeptidase MepM/ murein hydrolase activator NlpD
MTSPSEGASRTRDAWPRWILLGALGLALVAAGVMYWRGRPAGQAHPALAGSPAAPAQVLLPTETLPTSAADPARSLSPASLAIRRVIDLHTEKPDRPSETITEYTVQSGDSVFSIAQQVGLKPTTIYWANYDLLIAGAGQLSPGQTLKIPPVDGIYYKWQAGDTLQDVATRFKVTVEAIVNFAGNNLDPLNPQVLPGDFIMIQGGASAAVNWAGPVYATENVNYAGLGSFTCSSHLAGNPGAGNWVWPAPSDTSHLLSGNNFSSWHPGVDILELLGWPILAADRGVVAYAGWSAVGYGNLVVINHLNGWETRYAHLSEIDVQCGDDVVGGQRIGFAGSTGNSTGPHLHFEMRYNGSPVDPHTYYNIIP